MRSRVRINSCRLIAGSTLFTIPEDIKHMELKVGADQADVGSVNEGQMATSSVYVKAKRRKGQI